MALPAAQSKIPGSWTVGVADIVTSELFCSLYLVLISAVIWFGGAMSGSGWVLAGLAGPAALVTQTVSPLVPAGMLCLLRCASTLPLTTW